MSLNRQSKELRAEDWWGTRTVIPTNLPCGLCRDTKCEKCAHEIAWYEKLWVCSCDCNKSWKPKALTVEKKNEP